MTESTEATLIRQATWPLPADDLAKVGELRHLACATLTRWRAVWPKGRLDDVTLFLTELAANALEHAQSHGQELRVELEMGPDWVQVGVWDPQPPKVVGPIPASPPAEDGELSERGRGLLLTSILADEVVAEASGSGKLVRARVLIPAAAAAVEVPKPEVRPVSGCPVQATVPCAAWPVCWSLDAWRRTDPRPATSSPAG